MELLKILALEPDELLIISTYMQDAIVRIGDINFGPRSKQFVLVANRFEREVESGEKTGYRRRTGLSFSQVNNVRAKKIRQGAHDAILSLLSIEFAAGEVAPEGTIKLIFSGGGEIELEVECVEVQMEDLGARWPTSNVPTHAEE